MNDDVVLPRLWWCTCRVNVLNDGQRAQRALWGRAFVKRVFMDRNARDRLDYSS